MLSSFYKDSKPTKCVMRWNALPRIAKCQGLVLWYPFPFIAHGINVLKILFCDYFSLPIVITMYTGFQGKKKTISIVEGLGEKDSCWPRGRSGWSVMLAKGTRFGNAEEVPGGTTWFTHVSIFCVTKGWFCLKSTWKYSPLGFPLNLLLSPWEQVNMLL